MTPQQIELALETIALVLEDLKKTQEKQQATITALEEALKEHAMQEVQRLGQEIEPDDIASILACRDMLDAQPVPPQRKPLTHEEIFACENSVPDEIVTDRDWCIHFARAIEAKIKENT